MKYEAVCGTFQIIQTQCEFIPGLKPSSFTIVSNGIVNRLVKYYAPIWPLENGSMTVDLPLTKAAQMSTSAKSVAIVN
jgi:hypothetical protein